MHVWHGAPDTPRTPRRVIPGERVSIDVATSPIEGGQSVTVAWEVDEATGGRSSGEILAVFRRNASGASYFRAEIGPFGRGDRVSYSVAVGSVRGGASGGTFRFTVGPRAGVALLWHQHQPIYRDTRAKPRGSYRRPWVRLHAIRDYYAMASTIAAHPAMRATINLTPSLGWQLEDYVERGATDRQLELARTPAEKLDDRARDELLESAFDLDYANQVAIHPRFRDIHAKWKAHARLGLDDLRDLQMWASLAWFGIEMRQRPVTLVTGEVVDVHRFVQRGSGFRHADVEAMIAEQYKVMRAVLPLHRSLQDAGRIEVATSPFFHPILPLLLDTSRASVDRAGTSLPRRFAHPDDADEQVARAVAWYERTFGRPPSGMWPGEGAVSRDVVPIFARHGVRWIATDQGILGKSGRWGYPDHDPDVLCRPYRAEHDGHAITIFFRDRRLADAIGFRYHGWPDPTEAALDFVRDLKTRLVDRMATDDDHVVSIALDGENAWGSYRDDGAPFLNALYSLLGNDPEIEPVTFGEWLDGDSSRAVAPHPIDEQPIVHELFTGSWMDETSSAPGVDLGTWIGEKEENVAWELLGDARDALTEAGATPASAPEAFEALYMAEGSDWFWWLGDDQESGRDEEFDEMFRMHLANVYAAIGRDPPPALSRPIVQPRARLRR